MHIWISRLWQESIIEVLEMPRVVHFEIDAKKNLKKPSRSMKRYSVGKLKNGKDPSNTG